MQVSETFVNKKWQTSYMTHHECEQSIHVQHHVAWVLGGSLGHGLGKAKAKTFLSRPRPRLDGIEQGLTSHSTHFGDGGVTALQHQPGL